MSHVVKVASGDGGAALLLMVLLALAAAGVLALFWWNARATRKRFTCPSCGEVVVVEQMKASRCPTCGTPLGRGEST